MSDQDTILSLRLDNGRLRKALNGIMPFADSATKTAWDRAIAALSSTPEGTWEEVRALSDEAWTKEGDDRGWIDARDLDALLGGRA